MNVKNMSGLSELKPAGTGQQLAPTAATSFAPFAEPCRKVLVSVATQPVRVRFDGTDPEATTGNLLPAGYVDVWSRELAEAAKFLDTASGASTVFGSPAA
jgi:hypothetical protein